MIRKLLIISCLIFSGSTWATSPPPPLPRYQDHAPKFDAATLTFDIPCLRVVQPAQSGELYEYFFATKLVLLPEKWLWETREARLIPVDSDEFKKKCLKP